MGVVCRRRPVPFGPEPGMEYGGGERVTRTRRASARPWFGRLLRRRRDTDAGQWWAAYNCREVRLVHADRGAARAWSGPAGWHLDRHPDDAQPAGWPPGPRVGGRLPGARMMAELWMVADRADRSPTNHAPRCWSPPSTEARSARAQPAHF